MNNRDRSSSPGSAISEMSFWKPTFYSSYRCQSSRSQGHRFGLKGGQGAEGGQGGPNWSLSLAVEKRCRVACFWIVVVWGPEVLMVVSVDLSVGSAY